MEFYIIQNNKKHGPYSIDKLKESGISATTLVWRVGYANWEQAKNVPELSELLSTLPPDEPMTQMMPKTWLVESILVTCLCCLPFGIVGIINATKVEGLFCSGNYAQAQVKSSEAKKWTLWGFFISLICYALYILVMIFSLIISDHF